MDDPWTSYLVQHALCAECKTWISVLLCLHIHLVRWSAKKNWLRGAAYKTDPSLTLATASGVEKSSRLVGCLPISWHVARQPHEALAENRP
jgi:hypothetical protein